MIASTGEIPSGGMLMYRVVKRDGKFVKVEPDEVELGEIIQVKPGERVPLDGIVAAGSSSSDR